MKDSKRFIWPQATTFGNRRAVQRYLTCFASIAFALTLMIHANAEDGDASGNSHWTSFRNGGASSTLLDASLPTSWSPEKGIAWQVELPGYGQSSPLIVDEHILLTAVEGPQKENNLIISLDRNSGAERWRSSQPSSLTGPSNFMYSRAAPTPVADSDRVVAFFESGDLVAVGLKDGQKLWERDLKEEIGTLKSNHGLGSSLAHTDELLFVNLEHDGPSALLAIRKSDGSTKWKTERPSGSSWSSPVVMKRGDLTQVVVSSGGEAAGYDAESGKEIWKVTGLAGNSVPSPLVVGSRIYLGARMPEFGSVSTAAKSNMCLEFSEDSPQPAVAWRSDRCISDYASPVVCGGKVFLINGDGILGCLDSNTGAEAYRHRLGMVCWATPIAHQGHLYIFGKGGKATVVKVADEFHEVAENHLWDSANPPKPVSYVEHFPSSSRHGGHGAAHGKSDDSKSHGHGSGHGSAHGKGRKPGAGMLAGMLKRDANGDGILNGEEIPKRLEAVMENIDLNRDGSLDKAELKKMAESFAAKRQGSRQSSRDPIVYGVAADSSGIVVRTGTRLYAIGGQTSP